MVPDVTDEHLVELAQEQESAAYVDYIFEPPPSELQVSKGQTVTKSCVREAPAAPADWFRYANQELPSEWAIDFAESHLTVRRTDQRLLGAQPAPHPGPDCR